MPALSICLFAKHGDLAVAGSAKYRRTGKKQAEYRGKHKEILFLYGTPEFRGNAVVSKNQYLKQHDLLAGYVHKSRFRYRTGGKLNGVTDYFCWYFCWYWKKSNRRNACW